MIDRPMRDPVLLTFLATSGLTGYQFNQPNGGTQWYTTRLGIRHKSIGN